MLQSLLFVPTLREVPKDAEALSHQILLKGGYVRMNAAGLHLFAACLSRYQKENIIREELMPSAVPNY